MMQTIDYLVQYGLAGWLGRFATSDNTLLLEHGNQVAVLSDRGWELGTVLGSARGLPVRGHLIPGQLLGLAGPADLARAQALAQQAAQAFPQAQQLLQELEFPWEILDIEAVDQPLSFILHYLRGGLADERSFVSRLSRCLNARVWLHDLTAPHAATSVTDSEPGCGSNRCGSGGCATHGCASGGCGNHGGCATGCGAGNADFDADWQAYFAELRTNRMDRRISLPV